MSKTTWTAIVCDNCGRTTTPRHTPAEARNAAKAQGWLRIPRRTTIAGGSAGRDYCPACKANP